MGGWGSPRTTGDIDRIERALSDAGIPDADENGIAVPVWDRVSLLKKKADAAYEQGYADGESNHAADWIFALDEYCTLPDEVRIAPTPVAEYIKGLQSASA